MRVHIKRILIVFCLAALFGFPAYAEAEDTRDVKSRKAEIKTPLFTKGRTSFQFTTGLLFSPTFLGEWHPTFNYAQTNLRLNWMLTDPETEESFFRGNLEAILEFSTSFVCEGFGNVIIGPSLLIRYNFVQPGSKFIPYVQAGAGVVYTDAHEDQSQNAIGQAIEFTPQGSIGLHYLIGDNWSINVEAMYHHISNAGLADRNTGVNALGGFIGFTYFFERLMK